MNKTETIACMAFHAWGRHVNTTWKCWWCSMESEYTQNKKLEIILTLFFPCLIQMPGLFFFYLIFFFLGGGDLRTQRWVLMWVLFTAVLVAFQCLFCFWCCLHFEIMICIFLELSAWVTMNMTLCWAPLEVCLICVCHGANRPALWGNR